SGRLAQALGTSARNLVMQLHLRHLAIAVALLCIPLGFTPMGNDGLSAWPLAVGIWSAGVILSASDPKPATLRWLWLAVFYTNALFALLSMAMFFLFRGITMH